jgi:hypothetical protein
MQLPPQLKERKRILFSGLGKVASKPNIRAKVVS